MEKVEVNKEKALFKLSAFFIYLIILELINNFKYGIA